MKINLVIVALMVLAVTACEKKVEVPPGFEVVHSNGFAFFVYVSDETAVNDRLQQRRAGKAICELNHNDDYCDVYMWSVRDDIPKKLPILNKDTIVGLYTIRNGRADLRALWDNKLTDKEWYELGIGAKK